MLFIIGSVSNAKFVTEFGGIQVYYNSVYAFIKVIILVLDLVS